MTRPVLQLSKSYPKASLTHFQCQFGGKLFFTHPISRPVEAGDFSRWFCLCVSPASNPESSSPAVTLSLDWWVGGALNEPGSGFPLNSVAWVLL